MLGQPEYGNRRAQGTGKDEDRRRNPGTPHSAAASVVMKILYAARCYRFDLLFQTCMLARCVTKWTLEDGVIHNCLIAGPREGQYGSGVSENGNGGNGLGLRFLSRLTFGLFAAVTELLKCGERVLVSAADPLRLRYTWNEGGH